MIENELGNLFYNWLAIIMNDGKTSFIIFVA